MVWLPLVMFFNVMQAEQVDIFTDRPDFTEGTGTIPVGGLQIEAGATYSDNRDMRVLSGPETLVRFGIGENLEGRVGLPDYQWLRNGGTDEGWSDSYVGVKIRLPDSGPLEIALIPGFSVPTGKRGFSSDRWDPQIVLALGGMKLGNFDLSAGFVAAQTTEDGSSRTTYAASLSAGMDLTEKTGWFIEYAGAFDRQASPGHILHTGLLHKIKPNLQVDLHFGFGLSHAAPRSFIGAGIAYRF